MSPTSTVSTTSTRVHLPDELFAHYEGQAVLKGVEIEDLLVDHLTRTKDYTDAAPIYLNDRQASELRKLLGASAINTSAKLVDMIRRLCSWKVGGYRLDLSPAIQEQIVSYCKSLGRPVVDAAPELLTRAIRALFQV